MPAVDIKSGNSKDILFTAQSLKQAVKQNRDLIVFKQQVYDITKFTKFHPGGQLAIKHLVGKCLSFAIFTDVFLCWFVCV
jgi:delta8-fatty-acid desaturase